jgi:hypothetical protein
MSKVRLVFFPAFGPQDAAELTDQAHRVRFYARPVAERVGEIVMAHAPGLEVGAPPAYLDPGVAAPAFADRMRFVAPADLPELLSGADYILHWNTDAPLPPSASRANVFNIDRHRYVEECQQWLTLSSRIGGDYNFRVEESRARYRTLVQNHRAKRCYIFGTGPNLALAADHDYSQGVAIVCNSMVKNEALLDRMRPPLIVAADPIFHAGASVYAADFRAALIKAMERYGSYFLCNQRDFRIFDATLPEHLRAKLIGAPADWGMTLNTESVEEFRFTACPNVLTLFLLPIAYALSEAEIFIAGCDGRPLQQSDYFWRHDRSVQFNDKMGAIQEAHPSFFDISYDEYYFLHCETVASWIATAEAGGRRVVNMTPSFIPALRKRYAPPADVAGGDDIEERIPAWTRLRMRKVFLDRQLSAFRHGVLPRWKQIVRAGLRS